MRGELRNNPFARKNNLEKKKGFWGIDSLYNENKKSRKINV
jgi:hypothetical protein